MRPSSERFSSGDVGVAAFLSTLTTVMLAGFVTASQVSALSPATQVPRAQTLQPLGEWEVVPSETECEVRRPYGQADAPIVLGIRESISRGFFELIVTGTGTGLPAVDELDGSIQDASSKTQKSTLSRVFTRPRSNADIRARSVSVDVARTICEGTTQTSGSDGPYLHFGSPRVPVVPLRKREASRWKTAAVASSAGA